MGYYATGSVCVCEGLKEGDRILEVNGVNVECDFHVECAAKIQSVVGQVKLLVVDAEADAYFQQRQMPMSSEQPYVSRHACPMSNLPGPTRLYRVALHLKWILHFT